MCDVAVPWGLPGLARLHRRRGPRPDAPALPPGRVGYTRQASKRRGAPALGSLGVGTWLWGDSRALGTRVSLTSVSTVSLPYKASYVLGGASLNTLRDPNPEQLLPEPQTFGGLMAKMYLGIKSALCFLIQRPRKTFP